jgi:O-antigen/teichoic acid export membrane protein
MAAGNFGEMAAPEATEPHLFAGRVPLEDGGMREHLARGTIVNALFQIGLATLGVLKGVLVAAFLTTEEYGVWGILFVTLLTIALLHQVGIADKFIQQDEESQELAFRRAFTLELILSCGVTALFVASTPVLAVVYGEPRLVAPALVLALIIPLGALQVPTWIFYRSMRFVKQRTLQAIDPVVGLVATTALAISGAGYWSLVIGSLAGALVGGIASVAASPYRLGLAFSRGTARDYAGFSVPLIIAGASSLVIAQGSIIAGEATLGLAGAGVIAFAAGLTQYSNRVDQILTATLYPAICAVKDRTDLLFESFVKSNRVALMWGVPFGLGVALFAGDLVQFVIGGRWENGLDVIRAFGVAAALGHIGFNWGAFYRARGDTKPIGIWAALTMLAFLAVPLPLLVFDGLRGYAIGMILLMLVSTCIRAYYLVKLFSGFRVIRYTLRALAPSVPATAAVLVLRLLEGGGDRTAALALGELVVYVAVTALATWRLERDLLKELAGYFRRPQGPQRAAALQRG